MSLLTPAHAPETTRVHVHARRASWRWGACAGVALSLVACGGEATDPDAGSGTGGKAGTGSGGEGGAPGTGSSSSGGSGKGGSANGGSGTGATGNGTGGRGSGGSESGPVARTPEITPTESFEEEELTSVSISEVACGISREGLLVCEDDTYDFGDAVVQVTSGGLTGGLERVCVLLESGAIRCVGQDAILLDPDATYTELSQSDLILCGLRDDGNIDCETGPGPEGPFASLAVGHKIACGITREDELVCFAPLQGTEEGPEIYESVPEGRFQAVAVDKHLAPTACALTVSGVIVCFSPESENVVRSDSEEVFREIAVGDNTLCALTAEGHVQCFLEDPNQPTATYDVEGAPRNLDDSSGYTSLTADGGSNRYCALNADGLTTCWMASTVVVPGGG